MSIFISYSRHDQDYVSKLVQTLVSDHQLPVWLDDQIDYGDKWPRVIEENLRKSQVFLLVMSPRSRDSHWVNCELNLALKLKKPIFPILLEGDCWLEVVIIQMVDVQGGKLPPISFFNRVRSFISETPTLLKETLPNGITLEMLKIPTGSFLMGSADNDVSADDDEKPQHLVMLKEFYLGKYPVTQEQYKAVMGENPSRFRDKPQNPVENVSWDNAQVFCQKLNQMTQMRGKKYRLPSEAEWEYACRAGTQTRYYFGDDASQLKEYAWFGDNSGKLILDTTEIWSEDQYNYYERIIDNDCKTHPVGQKTSNNWGLYDMHGNVWEWCEDDWHENHKNAPTDGSAWNENHSQANSRSLRGSSWCGNPRCCRSANRFWYNTDNLDDNIGFRLALFLR